MIISGNRDTLSEFQQLVLGWAKKWVKKMVSKLLPQDTPVANRMVYIPKNIVIRVIQRISRAYRKSSLQSGNRKPPCNFACCQKQRSCWNPLGRVHCIAWRYNFPAAAIYYVATGRQQLQWEYGHDRAPWFCAAESKLQTIGTALFFLATLLGNLNRDRAA